MKKNTIKILNQLKEKEDAVILAHYYVDSEIQEIADYIGDSFFLAQLASQLENKTIVMAGVYFMGESIKILNPDKNVLLVDKTADCPMAHMITKEKIETLRNQYEDLAVVCYINSTANIKALSDVCVTSSNALKIVKSLSEKNIFFIPDGNLGRYVAKSIKDKNIIANDGYCPVHNNIDVSELKNLKTKFPKAKVLAHPECNGDILSLADFIGSTKAIIKMAKDDICEEFIIATEKGISYMLEKECPDKKFYFIDSMICHDMKLNSVDKIISALENQNTEVIVDDSIVDKAKIPLNKMLEMGQ
ncbi:MAG: quinolinate synthase NadA [Peptostreptococcus sp.]|uniref:quinolinate synthase NadA n=1 Tax=Peptostreptococcus sp. TaxID=1262 RepID=UPI002FC895DD